MNPATTMLMPVEIAARLRVSLRTVDKWIADRELASFQKGDPRVSEEELTKFVLLNTLKAKRPDWVTAELQSEFERRIEETIRRVINAEAQRTQRIAEAA